MILVSEQEATAQNEIATLYSLLLHEVVITLADLSCDDLRNMLYIINITYIRIYTR